MAPLMGKWGINFWKDLNGVVEQVMNIRCVCWEICPDGLDIPDLEFQ